MKKGVYNTILYSSADASKAVEVARGVKGVKSVKNDMRLK
jgi:osmotically-inducible protein OsmY